MQGQLTPQNAQQDRPPEVLLKDMVDGSHQALVVHLAIFFGKFAGKNVLGFALAVPPDQVCAPGDSLVDLGRGSDVRNGGCARLIRRQSNVNMPLFLSTVLSQPQQSRR